MRSLPLAALLLAAAFAPGTASAQEVVRLEVGESRPGVGTVRPICDTPAVAVISSGVLHAVGPGETLCSAATVQAQGLRRVYRVIVTLPDPTKGKDGKPAAR